jgi:hypothetical protein
MAHHRNTHYMQLSRVFDVVARVYGATRGASAVHVRLFCGPSGGRLHVRWVVVAMAMEATKRLRVCVCVRTLPRATAPMTDLTAARHARACARTTCPPAEGRHQPQNARLCQGEAGQRDRQFCARACWRGHHPRRGQAREC